MSADGPGDSRKAGQDDGAWDVSVAPHREALLRARRDDPLAQDRDPADWRDQVTADVEVLRGDARD